MIKFEVLGTNQVIAHLNRASQRQIQGLRVALKTLSSRLYSEVQTLLNGGMLQRRSGNLADAQYVSVGDEPGTIVLTAGFDHDAAPYGDILISGVPHSWDISPRSKRALRFMIGEETVFAARVTHPPMPPKNFLSAALITVFPEILPTIRASIREQS